MQFIRYGRNEIREVMSMSIPVHNRRCTLKSTSGYCAGYSILNRRQTFERGCIKINAITQLQVFIIKNPVMIEASSAVQYGGKM